MPKLIVVKKDGKIFFLSSPKTISNLSGYTIVLNSNGIAVAYERDGKKKF
jgi:hypothetical protein